jgi:hypothetical protein
MLDHQTPSEFKPQGWVLALHWGVSRIFRGNCEAGIGGVWLAPQINRGNGARSFVLSLVAVDLLRSVWFFSNRDSLKYSHPVVIAHRIDKWGKVRARRREFPGRKLPNSCPTPFIEGQ